MKQGYRRGIVHTNIQLATDVYEMKLMPHGDNGRDTSLGAENHIGFHGEPGQFYMLRGWELDPLLARPISICNISNGMVTFLYEVVGKGTRMMSELKAGDTLELLGPLGTGFDLELGGRLALISGGAGMAPLIYLKNRLENDMDFYCGFQSEPYYIDEIEKGVDNIYITTEDGSAGHRGFVTELFTPERYDTVITCGPTPMMKEIVKICGKHDIPVYMSMESHMACGIGTCLGCTVETTSGILRVCREGPVQLGKEVVFDD